MATAALARMMFDTGAAPVFGSGVMSAPRASSSVTVVHGVWLTIASMAPVAVGACAVAHGVGASVNGAAPRAVSSATVGHGVSASAACVATSAACSAAGSRGVASTCAASGIAALSAAVGSHGVSETLGALAPVPSGVVVAGHGVSGGLNGACSVTLSTATATRGLSGSLGAVTPPTSMTADGSSAVVVLTCSLVASAPRAVAAAAVKHGVAYSVTCAAPPSTSTIGTALGVTATPVNDLTGMIHAVSPVARQTATNTTGAMVATTPTASVRVGHTRVLALVQGTGCTARAEIAGVNLPKILFQDRVIRWRRRGLR